MILKYKIVEVWPNEHQIVVRYYTDIVTENDLALGYDQDGNITRCRTDVPITLPIEIPTGDEFEGLIAKNAPEKFLKLKEFLLTSNAPLEINDFQSLIGVEKSIDTESSNITAQFVGCLIG